MPNTLFDKIKHLNPNGDEFWYARELKKILEYGEWRNFEKIIEKAKIACHQSKNLIKSNFVEVNKIVETGISSKKLADFKLSRYACYLIAMNGDSSKPVIAQAQTYFAQQTRKQELAEEQVTLEARKELRDQERISYSNYDRALEEIEIKDSKVAQLTSQGDKALFTKKTSQIKREFGIKRKEPLADYLHPVALAGRTLAREMTLEALNREEINSYQDAKTYHLGHNSKVREALVSSNMHPENFPKMLKVSAPKKLFDLEVEAVEVENTLNQIVNSNNNRQIDLFDGSE